MSPIQPIYNMYSSTSRFVLNDNFIVKLAKQLAPIFRNRAYAEGGLSIVLVDVHNTKCIKMQNLEFWFQQNPLTAVRIQKMVKDFMTYNR